MKHSVHSHLMNCWWTTSIDNLSLSTGDQWCQAVPVVLVVPWEGPTPPGGPLPYCQFLPSCFGMWTFRKCSQTTNLCRSILEPCTGRAARRPGPYGPGLGLKFTNFNGPGRAGYGPRCHRTGPGRAWKCRPVPARCRADVFVCQVVNWTVINFLDIIIGVSFTTDDWLDWSSVIVWL